MDMLYHQPFRDWLELNTKLPTPETAGDSDADAGSGDSSAGR
jgi:hypothetical protein